MYLKLEEIFKREDINDYDKNRAIKAVTGMRYDFIDRMKQTDREKKYYLLFRKHYLLERLSLQIVLRLTGLHLDLFQT